MALQGINPVTPAQKTTVTRGGSLARPLGTLGGIVGGIGGGLAAAATGNPGFIAKGAGEGFLAGASAGGTLGNLIDPQRTKTMTTPPQSVGQVGSAVESISQKYKMSDAGRMALQGLMVAKAYPEYREFIRPLGMAVAQDIGINNKQRIG